MPRKCEILANILPIFRAIRSEKLAKFLQKAASTLLAIDDEDGREYMETFSNLVSLLEMSQIHSVNLWTIFAMKYHDHLKHSKAKTIKVSSVPAGQHF